jgi:hypothetical protein
VSAKRSLAGGSAASSVPDCRSVSTACIPEKSLVIIPSFKWYRAARISGCS